MERFGAFKGKAYLLNILLGVKSFVWAGLFMPE